MADKEITMTVDFVRALLQHLVDTIAELQKIETKLRLAIKG